jgi:hypothetical protein
MLLKPFIAGFAALIAVVILDQFLNIEQNLLSLVIGISLVGVVYSGVLQILGLPEDDRLVINRTLNKIKKSALVIKVFFKQRINMSSR